MFLGVDKFTHCTAADTLYVSAALAAELWWWLILPSFHSAEFFTKKLREAECGWER